MEERDADALELLLPQADADTLAHAHRITTFLRLLVDDARTRSGETVGVGLDRARTEMARRQRAHVRELVEELVRHHLLALADGDSFLRPPRPRRSVAEAWGELERHRAPELELPAVPGPGEDAARVLDRLLVGLGSLGEEDDPRRAVWAAWRCSVLEGSVRGEAAWRDVLTSPRPTPLPREHEVAGVEAVACCRLDRGAVGAAEAWLDEHLGTVSSVPSLGWLLAWTQLLRGNAEEAAATVRGLAPPRGPLPRPLEELRERRPAWAPLLPGDGPDLASRARGDDAPPDDRAGWGAVVLAVFAHAPGGATRALCVDAAPALAHGLGRWRDERTAAPAGPGEPEHELLVTAAPVVHHRRGRTPLPGALGRASSLALARQPILDDEGEVRGWIHLECEHHLLPTAARLRALAAAWRARIPAGSVPARPAPGVEIEARTADVLPRDDPRAEGARRFVASLGLKTAMRRWWCHDVQGDRVVLAAERGGAFEGWRAARGEGRALARAISTRAPILYPAPDPSLAQCAASASGLAVPLVGAGGVHAVLVVESTRRRDFRRPDAARLGAAASRAAPRWRAAQVRAWHIARFGHDVHLDPEGVGVASLLRDVPVSGQVRSAVALVGPEGVGKEVLARWLHFEAGDPAATWRVVACGVDGPHGPARVLGARPVGGDPDGVRAAGGTVVLDGLEELSLPLQLRLRDRLRGFAPSTPRPPGPRFVATLRAPLAEHVARGRLRADLAACFQRLELVVPPLAARRDEIPPLVRLLLRRFAREEDVAPVRLADEAMALLWRQPWGGNVRELEGLAYKLAVFHPGEHLDLAAVRSLAGRFGLDLASRVPSRRPPPADVRAALRVTRCASGSLNKTRAALYLGWDPDTLAARLRDTLGAPDAPDAPE